MNWGFPDSSVAKESACNAGDPSSFPGSGRCAGEGIGYPLQYCWDFPGGSVVETLLSNARGVGLIPGGKAKIPEALWCTPPKKR